MYKVSLKNPKAAGCHSLLMGPFLLCKKPAGKDVGTKICRQGKSDGGSSQLQLDLETAGCDGQHIKTDPAGNRHKETASCGGAMKATPDSLHVISFRESETAACDGQHRPALA